MIYFDNAASGGFKPDGVIRAVTNALKHLSANPGRSGHKKALAAAKLIGKTRDALAEFFNFKYPENVIFTSGATAALNLAVIGTARRGGHVVTTALEHNSVLRPLFELSEKGIISVTVLRPDEDGIITVGAVEKALTPSTYLIAVNHISNVTGAQNPVAEIGALARRKKILLLVDGAQSAGHTDIDLTESNIDMFAVPAHKGLLAPQGAGALLFTPRTPLAPITYGGTGTDSLNVLQPSEPPEAFESGTLNTPGIAGLFAALAYHAEHKETIRANIASVTKIIYGGLTQIKNVTLYSAVNAAGIISFNIKDRSSHEVADILNYEYDIAVRGGLHCAPLVHKHYAALETGMVRVSAGCQNTPQEAYALLHAVEKISKR